VRLLSTASSDAVSDLLTALTVRSSVYCLSELRAPWGFQVAGANVAKFHLVLEGQCWLQADGASPVRLMAGELAILPRGERHIVRDEPSSVVVGLDLIIADHPLDDQARLSYGGSGPRTRLLCGGFALAGANSASVLDTLPAVLRLNAAATDVISWLEPVLYLARQEADQSVPGAPAIFAKLADVFLAQSLRMYLIESERAGLLRLAPLPDPQIGTAVALIRDLPARPWTVEALAREVGMSRTLFSTRFRAAVGESPMRHVARVRLGQAAEYLTTTKLSVDAIARRTGYGNSAALSKAFKREYDTSPGQYRENQRTADIIQVRSAPAAPTATVGALSLPLSMAVDGSR
jgi:AraC family transcriptional regulator, alkane utilization regulator